MASGCGSSAKVIKDLMGAWEPVVLPAQWWSLPSKQARNAEERIAWSFLRQIIHDCSRGPKARRLKYIAEVYCWLNCSEAPYSFEEWTSLLRVPEDYMRDKLKAKLREWTKEAKCLR